MQYMAESLHVEVTLTNWQALLELNYPEKSDQNGRINYSDDKKYHSHR